MPTKTTPQGTDYDIDGKVFIWHPADDDDVRGNMPDVRIPLRIKLKLIRALTGDTIDVDSMFTLLGALVPDQQEVLDDMDVNDFQEMFSTYQEEYSLLTGASLGE